MAELQSKLAKLSIDLSELTIKGVGDLSILSRPCVAIVGSRTPTPYGVETTEHTVSELVRAGVVIISGLAFGIDAIAHRTALSHGGTTVAVLPSGIDAVYPASHRMLADQIAQTGLLITQFSTGHRPRKHDFLHRNRLIAGLSDAVIIPEAAERSGSLNTARHAQELGIPVFAVPGRITDHMSLGTNQLLKSKMATLITSAHDIIKALNIKVTSLKNHGARENPQEQSVLSAISSGNNHLTQLQTELEIDFTNLLSIVTQLEIEGLIHRNQLGELRLK